MKTSLRIILALTLALLLMVGSGTVSIGENEQYINEPDDTTYSLTIETVNEEPMPETECGAADDKEAHSEQEPDKERPNEEIRLEEGSEDKEINEEWLSVEELDAGNQPLNASQNTARIIVIKRLTPDIIRDGDMFWIEAELIGFEGTEYELKWQYDDGFGWHDMAGINKTQVPLIADRHNINYNWRVSITFSGEGSTGQSVASQGNADQEVSW